MSPGGGRFSIVNLKPVYIIGLFMISRNINLKGNDISINRNERVVFRMSVENFSIKREYI